MNESGRLDRSDTVDVNGQSIVLRLSGTGLRDHVGLNGFRKRGSVGLRTRVPSAPREALRRTGLPPASNGSHEVNVCSVGVVGGGLVTEPFETLAWWPR